MNIIDKKIVVLGAGISGLASAYWLKKKGFDVTIIESQSQPGGAMQTIFENDFLIDYGPNSGLETTPLIREIVEDIGFKNEMIYANEKANKRFILKNNKLYPLPTGPGPFLKTKLFSPKAKLRLMAEPFIGKSDDGYYQSIADFVSRRLGKEFLDYAIDPFVSGVFAGDPTKLSVKSAFPKLYRLEELYGGLIKGMIKGAKERKRRNEESKQGAKMFSFKNGMHSFPAAIANKFSGSIHLDTRVINVIKENNSIKLIHEKNRTQSETICDVLLSTIPASTASKIFSEIDSKLTEHLDSIFYPPVIVLYLGYLKKDIPRPLDGFGYLIPTVEKKNFLAIWSSTIFENRAPNNSASFTLFVGGAKKPNLFEMEKEDIISTAIKEFSEIMGINSKPIIVKEKSWEKAIPQYNIGYIKHENYFEKFEKENSGIFLSGNYRGGISVGDCIKNSQINFEKVKNYFDN